jgi:hypothetical protein
MSTIADAIMAFAGFEPDAPANTIVLRPKLPSGWSTMTFRNLGLSGTVAHRVDLAVSTAGRHASATLTNRDGSGVNVQLTLRVPPGSCVYDGFVTRDGAPVASYSYNATLGSVTFGAETLNTGAGAVTVLDVWFPTADFDDNSFVNGDDFDAFMEAFYYGDIASDFDGNGFVNGDDFDFFTLAFEAGC